MGFLLKDFTLQAIYTALTAEIKEHQAALKKTQSIFVNTVALKHQATFEEKLAKELQESLKTRFQHISLMSIARLLLETNRIELSECKDINEYCDEYQEAYDAIYNMILGY